MPFATHGQHARKRAIGRQGCVRAHTHTSPLSFMRRISSGPFPVIARRIGAIAASRQSILMSAPEYPSESSPRMGTCEHHRQFPRVSLYICPEPGLANENWNCIRMWCKTRTRWIETRCMTGVEQSQRHGRRGALVAPCYVWSHFYYPLLLVN